MKTNKVPLFLKDYVDTWLLQNPEYEYRFYDDNDILEFLKNDFPDFVEGYSKLQYGASKADLWRYLIIYKYGGVYADLDCLCKTPLKEWIDPDASYVTQLGINKDLCQWLIISIPQNPIFLKAAYKSLENIWKKRYKVSYFGFIYSNNLISISENTPLLTFNDEVLALAGPPVLQQVAEECYKEGILEKIFPFTQIVCVSDNLTSCQMNGNVSHGSGDNKGYLTALKLLKLKHYNNFLIRIKRKVKTFFVRKNYK